MLSINIDILFKFFLIFSRVAGALYMLPFFSHPNVTRALRVGFIFFVSSIMLPLLSSANHLPDYNNDVLFIFKYICSETCIGIILGITVRIYYSVILILGNIIAMHSGLGSATMFDPSQHEQVAIFGNLLGIMTITSLIVNDMHHSFIVGLLESYSRFAVGSFFYIDNLADRFAFIMNDIFVLSFKIGSPFIIVGTTILVASGILARLMPTLQILFVITPAQILIMIGIIYITMDGIIDKVIVNINSLHF